MRIPCTQKMATSICISIAANSTKKLHPCRSATDQKRTYTQEKIILSLHRNSQRTGKAVTKIRKQKIAGDMNELNYDPEQNVRNGDK